MNAVESTHSDLIASCKELRVALAAAMRVIYSYSKEEDIISGVEAFLLEIARFGIADGIGVRADAVIAKAEVNGESAAPDLLASCKDFVALYDGLDDVIGPSVKAKVMAARAAVAKAEGK